MFLFTSGLVLFLFGLVGLDSVVNQQVNDAINAQLVIHEPGSVGYNAWVYQPVCDPDSQTFEVFMFNITNSHGVMKGEQPAVEEFGPWLYGEGIEKFDISWSPDSEYVSFKMRTFYELCANPGFRTDDDMLITNVNVVFQALLTTVPSLLPLLVDHPDPCSKSSLCSIVGLCKYASVVPGSDWDTCECKQPCTTYITEYDRLFTTKNVHDWVFGWDDPTLGLISAVDPKLAPPNYPGINQNQSHTDAEVQSYFTEHTDLSKAEGFYFTGQH